MKEEFMKQNYPNEDWDFDTEREYLIDEIISRERQYLEYEKLKKDPEMNYLNTKIEINGEKGSTKIEVNTDRELYDQKNEGKSDRL